MVDDGPQRAPSQQLGADAPARAAVGDHGGHADDGDAALAEQREAVQGPGQFGFSARGRAVGQARVVAGGEPVVAPVLDVERRVADDEVEAPRGRRAEEGVADVDADLGPRRGQAQAPLADGGPGGRAVPAADGADAGDGAEQPGEQVAFVAGGVVDRQALLPRGAHGRDVDERAEPRRRAGPGGLAGALDEELEQLCRGGGRGELGEAVRQFPLPGGALEGGGDGLEGGFG